MYFDTMDLLTPQTKAERSLQSEEYPNQPRYKLSCILQGNMGVPFEALIPGVIIIALGGVTGAGMSTIRAWQNGGKRGRHSVDQWDRRVTPADEKLAVMERDRRLTGMLRGQTDNPKAPPGFELNNPWKLEDRFT
ncbi:MAG: hypothetical protein LQ339_002703 [Xanthoria mediterranea]|nr:MAG: hypothetical protein LQ339_002703 [Xanthoria mediterranea]